MEQVLINKSELDRLIDVSLRYQALEEAGVDNWVGYECAVDNYLSLKKEYGQQKSS